MKQKFLFLTSCLMLAVLAFTRTAWADDAQLIEMVKGLQKQMSGMQKTIDSQNQKISALENRQPSTGIAAPSDPAAPMSDYEFNQRLESSLGGANKWLKDLSFKGDLRLRYESFQNSSGNPAETDDRNRFRYRLRYGFEKKFNEDMQVGFSMASGEPQGGTSLGDPTSTNTTFDNNFSFKQINVEKVYAKYSPDFLRGYGPLKKTTFVAGKHDNPFEKGSSDMIWDRDVKPEGISEIFDWKLMDGENFDLNGWSNLGQYVLDEDATHPSDANLFAFQQGFNAVFYTPLFEKPLDYTTAVSYYSYQNYAKDSNFLLGTGSLARGNPNTLGAAAGLDTGDFEIINIYNELAFYPAGLPVRPFFDWAYNTKNNLSDFNGASDIAGGVGNGEATAWSLGLKLGGIVKKGDWELGYAYKVIDANSVPGFNDSDFGYAGHSGKRGNVFKGSYALTDSLSLGAAAFFVDNLNSGTGGILDEQQRRFQVDLVWKF